MEIAALLLTLGVFIIVGLYLYTPLLERRAQRVTEEEHELSSLMAERDRVVNSLQELDFDFQLGKVPGEDYPTQRANLLQQGADILRKIDTLTHTPATHGKRESREQDTEARLEKAIAERRTDGSKVETELTDDDLESMIGSRRKRHTEKSAGFCPKCGKPVFVSDRFCPACGKAL